MRKFAAVAATAAVMVFGATACGTTYTAKGTVVSKETDNECKKATAKKGKTASPKCATEYEIDIKQADGTEVEEKVTAEHYRRCEVGEGFPACTRD